MSAPHLRTFEDRATALSAMATKRRLTIERAIVGVCLADPARMIPVAESAGLDPLAISMPFRVVYLAAREQRAGKDAAVRFALKALAHCGYPAAEWFDTIADDYCPAAPFLQYAISRHREVTERIDRANEHARQAEALLSEVCAEIEHVKALRAA